MINQYAYIRDYEVVHGNLDPTIAVLDYGDVISAQCDLRRGQVVLTSFTIHSLAPLRIATSSIRHQRHGEDRVRSEFFEYPVEEPEVEERRSALAHPIRLGDQDTFLMVLADPQYHRFLASRLRSLGEPLIAQQDSMPPRIEHEAVRLALIDAHLVERLPTDPGAPPAIPVGVAARTGINQRGGEGGTSLR